MIMNPEHFSQHQIAWGSFAKHYYQKIETLFSKTAILDIRKQYCLTLLLYQFREKGHNKFVSHNYQTGINHIYIHKTIGLQKYLTCNNT